MSKTEWTDDKLEKLLSQLPKVSDNRDPRDLYQQIHNKIKKKKRTRWTVSGLATVAAMILFFILAPGSFNFNQNQTSNMESSKDSREMMQNENSSTSLTTDIGKSEQNKLIAQDENHNLEKAAVYTEDLEGKDLLIYGIPDKAAQNIVEISILVNKDNSKNWFEQLIVTMPKLTEEKWGLSDYYPLKGDFTYNGEQMAVNLDLPADHPYGIGSANEIIFEKSLVTTFANHGEVDKLTFTTSQKPGVVLGNNELKQLDISAFNDGAHPYFFLYAENNDRPLLVRGPESAGSLEAAFSAMRNDVTTYGLNASIPVELQFEDLVSDKNKLIIFIRSNSKLPQTVQMVYSIEAILLTAKEFGYDVVEIKTENTGSIGPFPFNQEIIVPVAPNKFDIEKK